jgi:hypothetical protein
MINSITPMLFLSILLFSALDIVKAKPTVSDKNNSIEFISKASQATMIELYTSEGCSSCPPAEARLNKYENDKNLWQTIIPIAFHVDYWDYIGWRDRFASPEHGKRQSRYAKLNHERTVYTPAFVVNGKNWRPGFIFNKSPVQNNEQVGILSMSVKNKTIHANFNALQKSNDPLLLNIAVLGMDLKSDIKRGENQGRNAEHHFVVLAQQQTLTNDMNWEVAIPTLKGLMAPRYALVAWVSREGHPAPLQAVGGYIPNQFVE